MSNYGESYYLEELEEMQKEKVVTINPEKQVIIDKSDLDLIYKQISDLEAKLAEKEKEIKARDKRIDRLEENYYQETRNLEWVNEQLIEAEKQLAEKDEEIAYLTKQVKKFNNEAQKYFEDAYCNDFHNQDKISFAVEVLKIAQDYVQQYVNNFDDMNDCLCAIDNQINQLTHQREDKGECNV